MTVSTASAAFLLTAGLLHAQQPFPDHCPDGSKLPFAAIEVQHPVDNSCHFLDGKQTSPAATRLQNTAKNNFCVTTPLALAETFTLQKLIDLQKNTHIPTGEGHEPASRSALHQLGEGKLIRMAAFIIEAHGADVGTGESVNCGLKNAEDNDIHIALGTKAPAPECGSVTAEISPHFRPATWAQIGNFATFKKKLQAQAFRFTGQLFFDSSHTPCGCGATCSPVRSSDWEIHPVYQIEACKTGTPCDPDHDSDWIPFDTWWGPVGSTSSKNK